MTASIASKLYPDEVSADLGMNSNFSLRKLSKENDIEDLMVFKIGF